MALSGLHVAYRNVVSVGGYSGGAPILGAATDSENIASPGTSSKSAPRVSTGAGSAGDGAG